MRIRPTAGQQSVGSVTVTLGEQCRRGWMKLRSENARKDSSNRCGRFGRKLGRGWLDLPDVQ